MSTAIAYRPAAKLQALLDEIEAADGEITPEQERQMEWLLHNEQVEVLDYAMATKELEARVKTSKTWRDEQKRKETRWQDMASKMRHEITQALVRLRSLGESTKVSDPAHSITVSLQANNKGRFELLGSLQDVPETHRKIKIEESLDLEACRADFENGHPVPGVKWIKDDFVRLT